MKDVWIIDDTIVSPLGETSEENFRALENGTSGVHQVCDSKLSPHAIFAGKIFSIQQAENATRFETLCIRAIEKILKSQSVDLARTLFIFSSTKGNIHLLDEEQPDHARIHLYATAEFLRDKFGLAKKIVVSNACISGVMALTVAKRFLQAGHFDHALVLGADELSRFVVSGFQSLQALSDQPCKPFDASRKGINLGEAAAAILLTVKPGQFENKPCVKILGSGLSNDANHISGPSRTGEELSASIIQALKESDLSVKNVDFISAHGTATLYNDEMEAKAFYLSGLMNIPTHSLKGYYGHTLGAAGVVETIMGVHSLLKNTLIPSLGFKNSGTSQPVNMIQKTEKKNLNTFLKTASGFGGCNAAIVLQKV